MSDTQDIMITPTQASTTAATDAGVSQAIHKRSTRFWSFLFLKLSHLILKLLTVVDLVRPFSLAQSGSFTVTLITLFGKSGLCIFVANILDS